jgi:hypothetical protein
MSDLYYDTLPSDVALGQIYRAVVKRAPSSINGSMDVVIPDIHPDLVFPNVRAQVSNDTGSPANGSDVLLLFDNNNQPWAISWWPSGAGNIDGGYPSSVYTPLSPIDGGGV